ncbi:uncharacterized protein EAF02_007174 [Botrytis sinoallii]|uniref:uncharacterized protein n=1 Tax=Botrytis sinoallii TaxID=1463999 RepID=UPI0019019819|nr:uncharacterized protein EAF02_007174 [Botrytis sinoallii]KAF7880328.1 hypothetical protein EAF02_007174 [Botrytis sinoallii]
MSWVPSVYISTSQVSVSRSSNIGQPSSSIASSPRTTFFAAPARSSKIAVPSSYVASTTTPAIEATTPNNMFQVNFWHEIDNKKKSSGNLWYMQIEKLDQNITSHDPLSDPIPYPEGSFAFPPKAAGAGCYYKGGRSAVDDVFCPDKPTVSCQGNVGEAPIVCDGNTSICPMVLCGLEG